MIVKFEGMRINTDKYTKFGVEVNEFKDNVMFVVYGIFMTDHLWFNKTKGFAKCELTVGDIVQFDARVSTYQKGYKGHRDDVYCPIQTDYTLSYPTKIKVIGGRVNEKI